MTVDGVDAIEFLQEDHRTIEQLLSELERTDAPDAQDRLVAAIAAELSAHAGSEEAFVYPLLRDAGGDLERTAGESVDQHEEMHEVLAELTAMTSGDPGFAQRLDALVLEVRRHIDREESEVLARLRGAVPADRLRQVGAQVAEARAAGLSTTGPADPDHVHLPGGGPSGPHPAP